MRKAFRLNALLLLLLSTLFFVFFTISKHDPLLSAANPFGEDPFDAVGSFGVQAAAFLSLLSLLRAFWPFGGSALSERRAVRLARTQMLGVLAVGVTLAADLVGMARAPRVWLDAPGGMQLAGLLGGLLALTVAAGALIHRPVRGLRLPPDKAVWARAALACGLSWLVLAVYPDTWRASTPGALFTVLVGIFALFAPMRAVSLCLVPYSLDERSGGERGLAAWLRRNRAALGLAVLLGIGLGAALVLAEMLAEGASANLLQRAFIAAVFIGLETAGLVTGYIFLRRPLGLFEREA